MASDLSEASLNFLNTLDGKLAKRQDIIDLKYKLQEQKEKNAKLLLKLEQKKEYHQKLLRDCNVMKEGIHLKGSDEERIKRAEELFDIGKSYTGIRWDYSSSETSLKGYLANKDKHILQPFKFNKDPSSEDSLWSLIEASASSDWSQFQVDEENVIPNK